MHDQSSNPYDVVIAGAGPVGLFLACELRLAGLQVLVLEQSQDPHSALKQLPFGLRGLSIPTLEAFHRRGLLEQIVAAQQLASGAIKSAAHWMQQTRRPAGHFAGIQFYQDNIDVTKWSWRLPTSADANLAVDMETLESVLAARACSMGVEIRRGFGVNAVVASSEDVTVQAAGETFRARWLVGCDGARSTVRKTGGFDFVGTDPEFTGIPSMSSWPIRTSFVTAATTRSPACIPMRSPGRSRWSISTAELSTAPSRSRASMCRASCVASPAPTSPSRRFGSPLPGRIGPIRQPRIAEGGCSSRATLLTSIRRWAARASISVSAMR